MQIDTQSEFATRLVDKILRARGADSDSRNQIHASDVGRCMRQTYFKLKETPPTEVGKDESDDRVNLIFKYGDALEHVLTTQMMFAGIWRGRAGVYDPKFDLTGTSDPTVEFEGRTIITEIKATHRKHFSVLINKFKNGECDNYYDQIQTYLWLYPKAESAVLIVGNRDMRPMDIQEGTPQLIYGEIQRDEAWKKANWARLQNLRTALDTNKPPACEYSEGSWQRDYCPWRKMCPGEDLAANAQAESDRTDD